MSKEIEIKIKKDGSISIEALNIEGASCVELTAALESALGVVESVSHKPNYFVEIDSIEQKIFEE